MNEVLNFFGDERLSFIPLFVAVDAPGALPIVIGFTEGMGKKEQSRMLRYAMIAAIGLGMGFVAPGKLIFKALGISKSHFLVAGGLILPFISARNLLQGERREPIGSTDAEKRGRYILSSHSRSSHYTPSPNRPLFDCLSYHGLPIESSLRLADIHPICSYSLYSRQRRTQRCLEDNHVTSSYDSSKDDTPWYIAAYLRGAPY